MVVADSATRTARVAADNAMVRYAAAAGNDAESGRAYADAEDALDALIAAALAAGVEQALDEIRGLAESLGRLGLIRDDAGVATSTITIRRILRTTIDHIRVVLADDESAQPTGVRR